MRGSRLTEEFRSGVPESEGGHPSGPGKGVSRSGHPFRQVRSDTTGGRLWKCVESADHPYPTSHTHTPHRRPLTLVTSDDPSQPLPPGVRGYVSDPDLDSLTPTSTDPPTAGSSPRTVRALGERHPITVSRYILLVTPPSRLLEVPTNDDRRGRARTEAGPLRVTHTSAPSALPYL